MAGKRPSEKYVPADIPDTLPGLVQFLYDELPRISQALNEFPVGLNVAQSEPAVPIGTVEVQFRLFEGATPSFDIPGGGWDSVLGEWTAPVSGLYQINANVIIGAFGSGQFDYGATLRLFINDVESFLNSDAGQDDFDLSCGMPISTFLQRESVLRFTIGLQHQQQSGTVAVIATLGISSTAQQ